MIFIACLIAFLATLSGGLFALSFKDRQHLILGFSAGAVVGVVFFDLLPEAIILGGKQYNAGVISSIIMVGFLAYMIFDRFTISHTHGTESHNALKAKLGAGSLSIHSFLDGIAIGWAFQISEGVGISVALAVMAHDFSDGINTVNIVLKERGENREAIKWLLTDAIAPVLGVMVTFFYRIPDTRFGLVLALFAGFFLYIGASDLLPQGHSRYPKIWTTMMTILGASVIYLVNRFSGM